MTLNVISKGESKIRCLTSNDPEWVSVMSSVSNNDFYHLAEYHRLAEKQGEGKAELYVYQQDDYVIALPLMLREIALESDTDVARVWDATSVYGYAGPIASDSQLPSEVINDFQKSLRQILTQRKVVTVFTRLHPLLTQQQTIVSNLGEVRTHGPTVSIDLSLNEEDQWRQYNKSLRNKIRKLKNKGAICIHDDSGKYLSEFADLYLETMVRKDAKDEYHFSETYFQEFINELNEFSHLFLCVLDDEVICGGLYTLCNGIIQAHLGGVRTHAMKYSPTTMEIDSVREWGREIGASMLHLGGGLGAVEDSVFSFKATFSNIRHDFQTWQWVLDDDAYSRINHAVHGSELPQGNYFPLYRSPVNSK